MRPTKMKTTGDPLKKTATRVLRLATSALDTAVRGLDNTRRVANFLRGRLELEIRPSDVFISSYPRSGTTLTQWILYLLTHEEQPDPTHLTRVSPTAKTRYACLCWAVARERKASMRSCPS